MGYYDAVMVGIGLKNLIGQGLEACYRYAKSTPQIENTAKLADDLENLVSAIDDLPIDARNKLDLLKAWASQQLKLMGKIARPLIRKKLLDLLADNKVVDEIMTLYAKTPELTPPFMNTIDELISHGLSKENNILLLKNVQYVEAQILRAKNAKEKPVWLNNIENYWLKPFALEQKNLTMSELLEYKKTKLIDYLAHLKNNKQRDVNEIGVVFGRRPAYSYTEQLDGTLVNTNKILIHDPSWVRSGIILPKVLPSNFLDNVIQACETAKQMNNWGVLNNGFKVKSKIYLNLADYDIASMMQAMYTNPNKHKVVIPLLEQKGNLYHQTRITDMEIANMVRNKSWFDVLEFIDIVNNLPKFITKEEAFTKYGIKYIGNILELE